MTKMAANTNMIDATADKGQDRFGWSNPVEFVLSILGFVIGLGNVWRFPYVCYTNGGGAFLIPYLVMLLGCGLPLVFMELTLGQYSREGPIQAFNCCPLAKGLGIGMVVVDLIFVLYYNMVTGWALYYIFLSLRSTLPWQCCEASWASPFCVSVASCNNENGTVTLHDGQVMTNASKYASDEYFHKEVLKISDSIDQVGHMQWKLVLCLLLAWFLVFVVLVRGIKSLGKIAYFTSTFPFLLLAILFIRSVIEPGASEGLKFLFTPRWESLTDASVWSAAAAQTFYSISVCCGGMIGMSSCNKFHNNLIRDGSIIVIGEGLTSLFSGSVVFSILGIMAHGQNTTIDSVVTSGAGLTFIVYPQAVTLLPVSPFWSVLFFTMLAMLALSTMFPCVETIVLAIRDRFHKLRQHQAALTFAVCFVMFLLGLILTTNGGIYILTLFDTFGVGYALTIIGIAELAVMSWCYGAGRLARNLTEMVSGHYTFYYLRVFTLILRCLWLVVTPALLSFSIIFMAIFIKPLSYGNYVFPKWAISTGWFMTSVSLLPIPLYAIYAVLSFKLSPRGKRMSIWEILVYLTSPSDKWSSGSCILKPDLLECADF